VIQIERCHGEKINQSVTRIHIECTV
jgi:hypothetical protein